MLSRIAFPYAKFRSYPALGRDGAIDLVAEDEYTTFIECKFHSEGRRDAAVADWRATAVHLRTHLTALAALEPEEIRTSPYAPWLDSERPVTAYWFCTSAQIAHASQDRRIAQEIKRFFRDIAQTSPRLSHLADLKIEVLGWAYFADGLLGLPALRYRWFGGLPFGLKLLDRRSGPAGSFKRFLDNEELPYFSPEAAPATQAPSDAPPLSMIDGLLNGLLSDPRGALVISGAGGVGKTRMALEIGREALIRGLLVVTASSLAANNALEELAASSPDPASIIVLIDYAESFDSLDRFVAATEMLADQGHRIHLLATCRNSALATVGRAMADLTLRSVVLDELKAPDGRAYADWVVDRILASTELSEFPNLINPCRGFPVLAAFALYLIRERPDQFHGQFGLLAEDLTFERWVDRRLNAAFKGVGRDWSRRLAVLSASLVLQQGEVRSLRDSDQGGAELIDVLVADQWLESETGDLGAAHDVFADAMISHYLFEEGKPSQQRLGDIIFDAQALGTLERALTALDRIAGHPRASALTLLPVLRELIGRDDGALASAAVAILRSRFLETADLIELLASSESLREAVKKTREADGMLSRLAKSLADNEGADFRDVAVQTLSPLLAAAVAAPQPSNMMLRRAFELTPDPYRAVVRSTIEREPTVHASHYLIAAWLRYGDPDDCLRDEVMAWLSRWSGASVKTSFVLREWLNLTKDFEAVAGFVRAWLINHRLISEAAFVYSAWLEAGGGCDQIADSVGRWLAIHGPDYGAGHVYSAWLDAGGGPAAIAAPAGLWLDEHAQAQGAKYLLRSWLNAGGSPEAVKKGLNLWIAKHGTELDAQFLYRSWFDATGKVEEFKQDARLWLVEHRAKVEAGFVYKGWLDADGGVDLIRADIDAWIAEHAAHEEADFVYKAWLDAGGAFADIRQAALDWFQQNKAHSRCVYITKYICKSPNLSHETVADLLSWCNKFSYMPDAMSRAGAISKYFKNPREIDVVFDVYLNFIEQIDEYDIEDYNIFFSLIVTIARLSAWLKNVEDPRGFRHYRLYAVHFNLLNNFRGYKKHPLTKSSFDRKTGLVIHVLDIVRGYKKSFQTESIGLADFVRWLSSWPPQDLHRIRPKISALIPELKALGIDTGSLYPTRSS